jgi:hypothetical protein
MHYDDAMEGWYFHTQVAHVNCCVELVRKTSAEDDVVWVVRSTTLKVMCSILAFSWPPKDTRKDIFLVHQFFCLQNQLMRVRRL